jgi:hypothetical protein
MDYKAYIKDTYVMNKEIKMKTNIKVKSEVKRTHGGGVAMSITPEQELRRSVMSCMLFEDEFYESGEDISTRIRNLIPLVDPITVSEIAVEARYRMNLRHIPLLIVREMARLDSHKPLVASTLYQVIQRADEIAEFVAIYWKDGKEPLSNQVKKGLSKAFTKFSEYELAKYNRDGIVKLKDVLFLCHVRPLGGVSGFTKEERRRGFSFPSDSGSQLFKKLVDNTLEVPYTWETELSAGKDKCSTFTNMIMENKLGALALLKNLRNMEESGVNPDVIKGALHSMNVSKILPHRFLSAYRHAPKYREGIENAMLRCIESISKLKGNTTIIVDVSGSMDTPLSSKSEVSRLEASATLAMLINSCCEKPTVYVTAGDDYKVIHSTVKVKGSGFSLVDNLVNSRVKVGYGGIFLKQVMDYTKSDHCDRIVVITDEQDCSGDRSTLSVKPYGVNNYLINVASARNGIGYGLWTHIDGISSSVVEYIREFEDLI